MNTFVSKLGRFNFTVHNFIAHPLMEILHLVGLTEWGNKVHDATLPIREEDDEPLTAIEAVVLENPEEMESAQPKPQSEVSVEHHETIRLFSEWCQCMGVEIPFDWQKPPHQINEQMQQLVVEYKTMVERGTIKEARQAFKDSISL
jgi:hypothetical protein